MLKIFFIFEMSIPIWLLLALKESNASFFNSSEIIATFAVSTALVEIPLSVVCNRHSGTSAEITSIASLNTSASIVAFNIAYPLTNCLIQYIVIL